MFPLAPLGLPDGIREIKQFELWKNWSQFVPHPHKEVICPKPPQDVMDKIKRKNQPNRRLLPKRGRQEHGKGYYLSFLLVTDSIPWLHKE
jgi:hypothetical protein